VGEIVRRSEYEKIIMKYNEEESKSIRISDRIIAMMEKYKFKRGDVESVLYLIERYNKNPYWIIQWRVRYKYNYEEIDRILEVAEILGCEVYTVRKILDVCDRDLYLFDKLIELIQANGYNTDGQILRFIKYIETNYASVSEFFWDIEYEEIRQIE